jgi:hypothetical protein
MKLIFLLHAWASGAMDNTSDYGSEDSASNVVIKSSLNLLSLIKTYFHSLYSTMPLIYSVLVALKHKEEESVSGRLVQL